MANFMASDEDAYGQEILDFYWKNGGYEIIERDDGFIAISTGPEAYFQEFESWPKCERGAITFAKNRVLDVGVGAGRVSLYLQKKGFIVTGIDNSPLSIEICRKRGVKDAMLVSFENIVKNDFPYDTVVMFGNNFGLFHNKENARKVFEHIHSVTGKGAQFLVESLDPYNTDMKEHLDYHSLNLAKGRMKGQTTLRIRYKKYVTPWVDYLLVSREEMKEILEGTGWKVSQFFDDDDSLYCARIVKE